VRTNTKTLEESKMTIPSNEHTTYHAANDYPNAWQWYESQNEKRAVRAGSLSLDKQYADYFPIFRVTAPLAPKVSQFATLRQGKPEWEFRRVKRLPRAMHIAIGGVMRRLERERLVPDAYWVGVELIDHARRAPWPIFCAQFGDCFVGLARWDVVGNTQWG
jgi:hypothetical protein